MVAFNNPGPTGNPALDAWALNISRQIGINTGISGGAGTEGIGSGSNLPTTGEEGQVFSLTAVDGGNEPGIYVYTGGQWIPSTVAGIVQLAIYIESEDQPGNPEGTAEFNWTTREFTPPDGWDSDLPENDNTNTVWVATTTISNRDLTGPTVNIAGADWSTPRRDKPPSLAATKIPGTFPTLTSSRVDADTVIISWSTNDLTDDLEYPGYHIRIERAVGETANEDEDDLSFSSFAEVFPPSNSVTISGLATGLDYLYFRAVGININGVEGGRSPLLTISPPLPGEITEFAFNRIDADTGRLNWTFDPGSDFYLRNFVLQIRTTGVDKTWRDFETIDADTREHVINGLGNESAKFRFRIKAVSIAGVSGPFTDPVDVDPVKPEPPSSFTATPVENVGVLTTVDLTWDLEPDDYINYESLTIQFRPVTDPASDWFDVATVSWQESEYDNLPPQQGQIEYQIRVNASNGQMSDWVSSGELFISGGSATDDAIYGGDGDFISTQHYSVNDSDITFNKTFADNAIVVGGTYNAADSEIVGDTDSELSITFAFNIIPHTVDVKRHFYVSLGGIEGGGTATDDHWGIDRGTLFMEILSDPTETADMYNDTTEPSSDTDRTDSEYVYTDSEDGVTKSDTNTRSYSERNAGGFMYATRTFIRLPLRRTFTFRESGQTLLRLRFQRLAGGWPIVKTDTANAIMLEAFSTEILETRVVNNVTSTGTAITFNKTFEQPPCIFATADAAVTAYFTSRSKTGVTIHTNSSTPANVDVTIRGY